MIKINKKLIILTLAFILTAIFGLFNFVSAQREICPSRTQAEQTTATLVGEITDDGRDPNLTVWFQYGRTSSYGFETARQSFYGIGLFCATIHNLDPCTTYSFRAVSQNNSGISYGRNRTFTTLCSNPTINPRVDLRANNLDGSITIPHNTSAILTWTSSNALSCTASGNWSGHRALSGSESTGNLASTRTYTITCVGSGGSVSDSVVVNVSSPFNPVINPTVDIRANNSDGSITIPHNTSAILTWTSNNASSCNVSGDWWGLRSLSGSESTGNLVSSRTYTITCVGSGGSVSDSVVVNVVSNQNLNITKLVRNISDQTGWADSVLANPGEIVSFWIEVTAQDGRLNNVMLENILPDRIIYRQNTLRVDGVFHHRDTFFNFNLGTLENNQRRIITFDVDIAGFDRFAFGDTQLISSSQAYTGNISNSDTARVVVQKRAVAGVGTIAGAATAIPTGLTNNLFLDSFAIPLAITILLLWLFKSKILKFEEWLDRRKKEYQNYKSKKLFELKVKKIRSQELFKKN